MRHAQTLAIGLMSLASSLTLADEPRPVPLTRPEMKRLLEEVKDRVPRIPLPELTADEKARLTERETGYEFRLRTLYLPEGWGFGAPGQRPPQTPGASNATPSIMGRNSDANMTLDYAFKTELFWIVSRTNNCQYCLGHQESKLLAAGLNEDTIAALDSDWTRFTPAEQAAFAYARKITFEPHNLADADIETLRKHYNNLQILEMTLSVAGNNAINRWKEGAGIPQVRDGGNFGRRSAAEGTNAQTAPRPSPSPTATATATATPHTYLTETSEKYRSIVSKVAPLTLDPKSGTPTRQTLSTRPALESRGEVEKALAKARTRSARLPMLDEGAARSAVSEAWTAEGPLPNWVRLVAHFPKDGRNRIATIKAAEEKGELSPLLKAQVSWIVARQDRAWYATGLAKRRLLELGQTEDQIYQLDGDSANFSAAEQAQFTLARKLSTSPVVLTDEDVTRVVKLTGPKIATQLICYVTTRAAFDRITEAAGLPIE